MTKKKTPDQAGAHNQFPNKELEAPEEEEKSPSQPVIQEEPVTRESIIANSANETDEEYLARIKGRKKLARRDILKIPDSVKKKFNGYHFTFQYAEDVADYKEYGYRVIPGDASESGDDARIGFGSQQGSAITRGTGQAKLVLMGCPHAIYKEIKAEASAEIDSTEEGIKGPSMTHSPNAQAGKGGMMPDSDYGDVEIRSEFKGR